MYIVGRSYEQFEQFFAPIFETTYIFHFLIYFPILGQNTAQTAHSFC